MKPNKVLESLYSKTLQRLQKTFISDKEFKTKVEVICRCCANKSPIRFLLSCMLAKIDKPNVDIRKPYTEIEGKDTYSGRFYDENYVESFVIKYRLPCNSTTAFLTPAFRNINRLLTTDLELVGRPREVYDNMLELLDAVYNKAITPKILLQEILRLLIIIKKENESRMKQLLDDLKYSDDILPLSSEQILTLLHQLLNCKNSSRLPVLMITSAYLAVQNKIGEISLPLQAHNAADKQTGSIGDVEITLINDDKIITSYEMKDKRVTINDIDHALKKISELNIKIDNYIFITTDIIEIEVVEYARSVYEKSCVEIAVLDCMGFLKHYLHFFHRNRIEFLNIYQELVLKEPNSSVSQPLKEVFLHLRKTAESE